MLDHRSVRTAVDEQPARPATPPRQTDAAGIEHPDAADLSIRRIVRMTARHPIGIDVHEETTDLIVRRFHIEPRSVIGGRRCVHAQQSCAVVKLGGLAIRETIEEAERSGLVENASCPCGGSGHQAVSTDEVDIHHCGFRCRMGVRLIVGEHVPVGVPRDERDILEIGEHLEHLNRMRAEHHEITEHPVSAR